MDASERGALMLVRFVAIALICVSVVFLALAYAIESTSRVPVTTLAAIFKSLPALAGIIMLVRARAIAQWVANLLDG